MTKDELKAYIAERIRSNHARDITGPRLQDVLDTMVDDCFNRRKTILSGGFCALVASTTDTYSAEELTKAQFGEIVGLTDAGVDALFSNAPDKIFIASPYGSSKSFYGFSLEYPYAKVLQGDDTPFSYEDETNQLGIIDPAAADCVEIRLSYSGSIFANGVARDYYISLGFTSGGYFVTITRVRLPA